MIRRILDDTCSFYGYYWKEAGFWMTRGSTQLTRDTCGVTREEPTDAGLPWEGHFYGYYWKEAVAML